MDIKDKDQLELVTKSILDRHNQINKELELTIRRNQEVIELRQKIQKIDQELEKSVKNIAEKYDAMGISVKDMEKIHEKKTEIKNIGELIKKYEQVEESLKASGKDHIYIQKLIDTQNKKLEDTTNELIVQKELLKNQGVNVEDISTEYENHVDLLNEKNSLIDNENVKVKSLIKLEKERNYLGKQTIIRGRHIRDNIQSVVSLTQNLWGATKKIIEPWAKVDVAVSKYARNVGMSVSGMQRYKKEIINTALETASKFGATGDILAKQQQGYSELIGRNVQLTKTQTTSLAAMSFVMGEDVALDISGKLENFGVNVDDVGQRVSNLFNESSKKGLVFAKTSKNFADNIKMAQQYTFKNGLEGLKNMAVYATKMRLDMQTVAQFADKVQTPEGAIETAANLQVLGGSFAQFSNPMGMLYESLNDMEGLSKRMVGMFSNMGRWNAELGEVEISATDRMRMRAASQAAGVDYGTMTEMVQQQVKRSIIEKNIGKSFTGDEDLKELILNTAQFNKKTNSWGINNGRGGLKDISQVNAADKARMIADTQGQNKNINDIALGVRNIEETLTGVKAGAEARQAKLVAPVGEGIKNIADKITQSNTILWLIAGATMAGTAIGGFRGSGKVMEMLGKRGGGATGGRGVQEVIEGVGGKGMRGFAKSNIGKAGIVGAGAVGGYLLNSGVESLRDNRIKKGKMGAHSGESTAYTAAGQALQYGAIGASIGSIIPGIGTAIGAAVGAIGGGIYGYVKGRKNQREGLANEIGIQDSSKYSLSELKEIDKSKRGGGVMSLALRQKMRENGDENTILQAQNMNSQIDQATLIIQNGTFGNNDNIVEYGNGGILRGKSHSDGGMHIMGTNQSVEGGEFVVNAKSTANNIDLLNSINSGVKAKESFTKVATVIDNKSGVAPHNNISNQMNINPIEIRLSGNIKLDTNTQSLNINKELMNNPAFINALTDLVSKQMNTYTHGAFNKESYKQKWTGL